MSSSSSSGNGIVNSHTIDSGYGEGNSLHNSAENIIPRDFSRLSLLSSITSSSPDEQFQCEGHAESTLSCMHQYLEAGKLCDVTLVAGSNGKRIAAHRLVLAAGSEYFAAMFTGSLREMKENEIVLTDFNGDVLQSVVNYCYSGTIDIREDNVEALLSTACLMQLTKVIEACSLFLVNQLHPSNCLGIAMFAEHQNCSNLLSEASSYINENFMQVIKNQEFLQLPVEQVATLLSSDDLNVSSEAQVFAALMNWINHDLDGRKQHLSGLLALVKLPLLEPTFLMDHVDVQVGSDLGCQKLIMEAMKWHLLPSRRSQLMGGMRTRPRKSTLGRLVVVGGSDKSKGPVTIEEYDARADRWTVTQSMTGRRLQFGVVHMGDKLFVVGGRDGLKTLNSMECLDMETFSWTPMSAMTTHRHGLAVTMLEGPIYAIGGHDGWSYLNTAERYDPVTRSWNYIAPMQNPRCSAGVGVLDGKIYIVGGRDGTSCLRTVERFDPHTNKWSECAPMIRRRSGVGVAVLNGFLYAIGGQDAPANNPAASRFDCVERYDPSTDSWSIVASLSNKRDTVAACIFGDKIIAAGGYDGNHYLSTVEQYDSVTNEWRSLAPLNTGRAGACIVPIPNNKDTLLQ